MAIELTVEKMLDACKQCNNVQQPLFNPINGGGQ